MNLNFLSAMSPLTLLVLLVFLFAIAVVVALWSLFTLGSSPRGIASIRTSKASTHKVSKEKAFARPLRTNRFMKQPLETEPEDIASELPTNHVSRSRVRILKTLEPDPEVEIPQFKPTTYDQMVNRQRAPKTSVPTANTSNPMNVSKAMNVSKPTGVPKTGLPTDSLSSNPPKPTREVLAPKESLRGMDKPDTSRPTPPKIVRQPLASPPRVSTPPLRAPAEDTSTQPLLFETRKRQDPPKQAHPSVQRQESEEAFRASQGLKETEHTAQTETQRKPKTQAEKDDAFEQFLRKHDDLGF
jgi:hypothetical protein